MLQHRAAALDEAREGERRRIDHRRVAGDEFGGQAARARADAEAMAGEAGAEEQARHGVDARRSPGPRRASRRSGRPTSARCGPGGTPGTRLPGCGVPCFMSDQAASGRGCGALERRDLIHAPGPGLAQFLAEAARRRAAGPSSTPCSAGRKSKKKRKLSGTICTSLDCAEGDVIAAIDALAQAEARPLVDTSGPPSSGAVRMTLPRILSCGRRRPSIVAHQAATRRRPPAPPLAADAAALGHHGGDLAGRRYPRRARRSRSTPWRRPPERRARWPGRPSAARRGRRWASTARLRTARTLPGTSRSISSAPTRRESS